MNASVFVLGLEREDLERCSALERALYHFVGLGFWLFLVLAAVAGGVNFYYVNDFWLTIALGALAFPVLLGFLYRILLLSVKRPPRFFAQKWYARWVPDFGTFVRLAIGVVLTILIAMPVSGILQYHRVERVASEKREELKRLTKSEETPIGFASSIQSDLEKNEHTHYPVAVYSDLLKTPLTRFVILLVGGIVFAPVALLLLLKFGKQFQYQEGNNARVEQEAQSEYSRLQQAMVDQLTKFGAQVDFPHSSAFEDYPINSVKKEMKSERVRNDDELLKLLWLPKK